MAAGVGVAIGAGRTGAGRVDAAVNTRLTLDTTSTTIATSNSYGNYAESSTSYQWAVTCGSKQSSGLWLGSNSKQSSKMTLGNGSYSDASGIASAISVQTSSTYYAAIIQRASTIANVDTVTLTYSGVGGSTPTEAWVLYSTSGTTWNIFQRVTSLSTTGTDFTHSQIASARYAFVIHASGYSQFKDPKLVFKGTDSEKTLSSIALSGTYPTTFTQGGTFSHDGMTVTATYSDSTTADVTSSATFSGYNLSNTGNQTVTVSYTEGVVTKTATYTITVSAPVAVTSVSLNKASTTIAAGATETLVATVEPSNASNKTISWTSSDNDVATVDSNGVVTGVGAGTATITATSAADNTKYDTCDVTVTAPTSATITYSDVLGKGAQGGGTSFTHTKSLCTLDVSSGYGNTSYFHVYKNATMTISSTLTFVKVELTDAGDSNPLSGFASITGYSNGVWEGESKSITFTASNKQVHMTQIKVTYKSSAPSVEISTSPAFLVEGGSAGTLTATITNDNSYTITWSASPNTGVTFSPLTSSSGGNVSISFDGTTTGSTPIVVTATLNDTESTQSEGVNIYSFVHAGTSSDPFSSTEADIYCNPSYAGQSGGDWYVEGYVVGEVANNKGYYIDEDPTATTSPYKFEVFNNDGIVNTTGKTITVGTSKIIAHGAMYYYGSGSQSEITGSIITSVDNGNIPSIGIDGGDRIVDINDTVTLTVTKQYDEGATVSWQSSNTNVATVSGGALTLITTGSTNITASMTVDGVVYSSVITVTVIRSAFSIGDEIYFYAEYSSNTYYMSAIGGASSSSTDETEKIVFTVVQGSVTGSVAFKHEDNYLKCTSTTPYSGSSTTLDADTSWIAIDTGSGLEITTCSEGTQAGRKLMWNYNNGNSPRFGCYNTPSATMLLVSAGAAPRPTTVSLTQHSVTLENGSSTTLTYTSDNVGTFLWTSSSPSVATVTDGLVECLADSGTTIIRIFYDTNKNGSYDAGEPTDTCTITAEPGQIHFGDANYGGIATRIDTDSSGTSLDGKKIIFGCAANTAISGALEGQVLGYHDTDETEFDVAYDSTNHIFTVGDGLEDTQITIFTLHSISSGNYSISAVINGNTKYLSETAVKKLAYSDSAYSWGISISSGTATISATNGNLQYNSGSPRFTTYSSGQTDIEIYEYKSYYDEATDYAELFVGGSSGTCSATISDWSTLSELFDDLTTGAKNIFKIATHYEASSYSHELTVEHAVARYDDAIIKHAELRSDEFMHRFETGGAMASYQFAPKVSALTIIGKNTNTVAIIVIISMVSVTAIGGYFFLRKRKENI